MAGSPLALISLITPKMDPVGMIYAGWISKQVKSNYRSRIKVSPDKKWMILSGYNDFGIELYDATDMLIRKISDSINPASVIWRLDSNGVFFRYDTNLYYLAIPDGVLLLVDQHVATQSYWDFNFTWIKK